MRLAKEGTVFRHAYCAAPTCTPSRSALLSGMSPHSCGIFGLTNMGFKWPDYSKHLVSQLNGLGYETALSGVQHEYDSKCGDYQKFLFDMHGERNIGNTDWDTLDVESAIAAAEYIKAPHEKPFFLSNGYINTHREFKPHTGEQNPGFLRAPAIFPDIAPVREDMADFVRSVSVVDRCVGIVLDAVAQSGIAEDTFIFFTTDHGVASPRMKCNLYDEGIGVSLIIRAPGGGRAGQTVDALTSHIDLFPTICDYLQIPKPEWLQGNSLEPFLNGRADRVNDEIFSEVTYHAAYEPMRAVRTQRYKYIRRFHDYEFTMPSNVDDSPLKELYKEWGFFSRPQPGEMLFDLYLDPCEREDLAALPEYAGIYSDMKKRLDNWMRRTGDPLLEGRVGPPPTATVCKPGSFSIALAEYEYKPSQ